MQKSRTLLSRTFAVVALSVVIYGAVAVFVGWDDLRERLGRFPAAWLPPLAGLSLLNYVLRYWRWEIFLRAVDVRLPRRESLGLFFATFVMVITPGKIGEVFKAGVLRERYGVTLARGLPVVLAERIADFVAVLVIAAVALVAWPGPLTGLTSGLLAAAGIPVLVALCQWRPVRERLLARMAASPLLGRRQLAVDEAAVALGTLLGARCGSAALVLSLLAWGAECAGLGIVCRGLDAAVPWLQAAFVYAAGTLVGSLSFLPGGLGGTEATIIWLLESLDIPREAAGSAALLVRLFTLWLAVVVGGLVILVSRHLFLGPDARGPASDEAGPADGRNGAPGTGG
ncbi:flippase-like domain-containing protein [bacterium]|nr:flippase-like domain-containing protein [bacterium]